MASPMRFTKRVASESQLSKAALSIWAKTNFWNAAPPDDGNKQWLPLAVHMADSGEVAELIWDKYLSPRQRKLLVEPLVRVEGIQEPTGSTLALLKLIVGAHDIGKCSPMFLTQNIELYERIFKNSDYSLTKYQRADELRGDSPHSWIGEIAFEKWLESRWNPRKAEKRCATAKQLGSIIGAHHGRPVSWQRHADMENPNFPGAINGDKTWKKIRRELLDWWMDWTDSQEVISQCKGQVFPTTWQSLVAGITVMADWIASNQELFPLVDWGELYPTRLISCEHHRQRTKAAWEKLHLPPSWQPEMLSQDPDQLLQSLFGLGGDAHARPAQVAAVEAAEKMALPGMMIIEEVMGAGKTEAALMAAIILAKRAGTSGVLVALPTKATTDAMFTRVVEWAQTAAKSGFSLKLQHGNAALNSTYKKIQYGRIASAGNAVSPGQSSSMGVDEESAHSRQPAVVHRWFKKKAALLASVVVCTVDHLLFSALRTKHVSLRHLGISDKVVIIDEVHSYDVYTSEFLKRTVQWLGAFGVPVIALSATLTRRAREELFAAYEKGQELKEAAQGKDKDSNPFDVSVFAAMRKPQPAENGTVAAPAKAEESDSSSQATTYPVLSYSEEQGVKVRPLPVLATKEIEVEHWKDDAGLVADLQTRLQNGGCVLVVRNTVANAQRTYETLRAVFGEDVRLVHSRFTQQDRQDNDEWLVRTFGKPGKSRRPKRAIVVGTQVVEQSLDIDFDVLYSDLAPIDLVFQRMGRVHRHQRDSRPLLLAQPRCILMGVPGKGNSNPQLEPGSTYIYDEDVLLRTAAYVLDKEGAGEVKLLNRNHSVDLALFGRMVADDAAVNVDASCQVAHAISTHSVENEFDFFTAVDDVKSQDEAETDAGAGMMGTVEFNSSTLYRYATINLDMLRENLGSDDATVRAVDAFAQAFVKSMPTGKQNTFANRTLPEAVYVSVRDDQPVSLVGAFENAITSREGTGFVTPSVSRLVKEAADIEDAYGVKPLAQFTCGVGDSREQLRQIQEPVAFPQLISDLDNLVTELLAKGE